MAIHGVATVKRRFLAFTELVTRKKTQRAVESLLQQWAAASRALTPVDTGALLNSMSVSTVYRTGGMIHGDLSYSAPYAGYVNKAPGTLKGKPRQNGNGNYWDPNGEPQFLQKGAAIAMGSNPISKLAVHYRV